MFIDARSVTSETLVGTDLCIVGGGAAGITLARELASSSFGVVLLESGSTAFEHDTQELYVGRNIGRPYLDLATCRLRYFGGTTNHWGGWCAPLNEVDFEEREGFPYSGWPFDKAHLDPWYRRAHEVCRLGAYDYGLTSWNISPQDIPEPFRGPHFISKISRSNPTRFGTAYKPDLDGPPRVTVYLNANAVGFDTNEAGTEVQELRVAALSGTRFRVRARIYVLAAGGIENARLLLLSGKSDKGLGNERDLVGRFFMVHLTYSGGAIAVSDPYINVNFANSLAQPHDFFLYIGLSDETMRAIKLPNFRFTVEYKFANVIRAVDALKRLADTNDPEGRWVDVQKVVRDLDGLAKYSVRKAFSLQAMPIEAMILHCDSEQLPNPESRVSLGSKRDALGLREVVLDWRLTAEDKRNVNAVHRLLGAEVGRAAFGRLRYMLDEDDSIWPEDLRGNEHHMGTTRMHRDPAKGVVDENCRVHGLANLYVAGSSVFPTGGVANPTLTIVTLALRLADHIKEQLA